MKKLIIALLLTFASSYCLSDDYVNGYTRSNGTYVEGHYRSSPNSSTSDNYSTKGNSNPYTGQQGYRQNEYSTPSTYGNQYNNSNNGSYSYDSYGNRR